MKNEFVERMISAMNRVEDPPASTLASDSLTSAPSASNEESESGALKQLSSAPIPTSVTALHGHPLYVLERHIGKYQALRPLANGGSCEPVGELNGERVYLRSAVETLQTREGWLKEARDVRLEERDRPAKVVRGRENHKARKHRLDAAGALSTSQTQSSSNASLSADTRCAAGGVSVTSVVEPERPQVGLYRSWQTAPYVPPAACRRTSSATCTCSSRRCCLPVQSICISVDNDLRESPSSSASTSLPLLSVIRAYTIL